MAKKVSGPAPGACPICWQVHPDSEINEIYTSENPNIIIIGWPRPVNKHLTKQLNLRPIIIPPIRCGDRVLPPKRMKGAREDWLFPILKEHKELPVVVMGEIGFRLMNGGNPSETSLVGYSWETEWRQTYSHTYSLEYWNENEKRKDILEHIYLTIKSALASAKDLHIVVGELPEDLSEIVVDLETTGKEFPWYGSRPTIIGIKSLSDSIFYGVIPDLLSDADKRRISDNCKLVIGHNLMYDLLHLRAIGITFPKARFHDTLIYHKCFKTYETEYGLKFLGKKYFGMNHWDSWFSTQIRDKADLSKLDEDKLVTYNAGDLYVTESLYKSQKKDILSFNVEMDYLQYVYDMIWNGMKVDTELLEKLTKEAGEELEQLDVDIRNRFGLGPDFNFNSPDQLLDFLRQFVPDLPNTQEDTLKPYFAEHPALASILRLKNLTKLKGTSYEGLKGCLDKDSFVHSSISVHGAETGRSTSSGPNLQNTDPRVRPVFISRYDGGRLIHTDLSGIEYRLIAHDSADRTLCKLFSDREDIHTFAYEKMFQRLPADKVERKLGKTANFLGIYGGGFKKFSKLTGLEGEDGKRAYGVVSGMYPGVEEWKERTIQYLQDTGTVRNIFGRVRRFLSISSDDEREAINWKIQSSGHDILKIYCMEIADAFKKLGLTRTLLIMEVHDSVTFDSPPEEWEIAYKFVESLAKDLNPLIKHCYGVTMRVPIEAEVLALERWE